MYVHTCGHHVPLQPALPWGVGACDVSGLHELGVRRVGGSDQWWENVSVPNSSFAPQENSDVFLSAVDTDWKVGPAMEGAPHPWVLCGTAA